jgi:RimJ/RimL family protein N-acetyltransferase
MVLDELHLEAGCDRLIYDQDQISLLLWMQRHADWDVKPNGDSWHVLGCVADGQIAAVVLYDGWDGNSVWCSITSSSPRWATRGNLRALFEYPFVQIGANRMGTLVSVLNADATDMNKRLGFRLEGLLKAGHPNGDDAVIFGMLQGECKWLT